MAFAGARIQKCAGFRAPSKKRIEFARQHKPCATTSAGSFVANHRSDQRAARQQA
jgi:ribosomal protein S27AE